MPLDVTSLQKAFSGFISAPPLSIAEASSKWAQAYFSYAQEATAAGSVPTAALAAATYTPLAGLFAASMTAQTFLTDMSKNLTMFWTAVPFVGVNNGPVSIAGAGAPALDTAIQALALANKSNRGTSALDDLATAIDVFTKAVTVLLVSPTGVAIPTLLL